MGAKTKRTVGNHVTEKPKRIHRGVASSETAREINRDIVLHAIHRYQPVSRADLARLTGLQPSTVSVIISLLIDEGWVLPGTLGRLPRGRRPTFVTLNDKHVTLAIDLKPGNASLAVIDINGRFLSRETISLAVQKSSKAELKQAIARIAKSARAMQETFSDRLFAGVGVSVSGRVDQKTHQVLFSPNVPWAQVNLYDELQNVLEAPVELENAVNACLVAERWFGNYGKASNVIVVGVSDGIGTGLLVDGHLARGKDDMAGEFGHMPIESGGPVCGCGNVGCWETFASNRAGLRYYHEFVPDSTVTTFKELLDLAVDGNIQALRSIDKMMMYLSRGLTIMVAGLAPEVVIVVGDCTVLWPRISPILESQLIAKSFRPQPPKIVPALDGDAARLRGAAALVLRKVLFKREEFDGMEQERRKMATAV